MSACGYAPVGKGGDRLPVHFYDAAFVSRRPWPADCCRLSLPVVCDRLVHPLPVVVVSRSHSVPSSLNSLSYDIGAFRLLEEVAHALGAHALSHRFW